MSAIAALFIALLYDPGSLKICFNQLEVFVAVFRWVGDNLLALEHERISGAFVDTDATADAEFRLEYHYLTSFVLEFFHFALLIGYPGYSVLSLG